MTSKEGTRFLAGILALSLVASAMADPKDFVVSLNPVFSGSSFGSIPSPVAVDIENKGPNAKGQVVVSNGDTFTRYPVDLPRGAKKRVVTYPEQGSYGGQIEFTLDTDQGRLKLPFTGLGSGGYYGSYPVVMIADTSGDLGFLRQQDKATQNNYETRGYLDSYCKPENAPDRPVGYRGIAAVVLGEGAERLSDDAVKALQSYALTGGTVVLVGGASAPVLSDRRWVSLLPEGSLDTKTVKAAGGLAQMGGSIMPDSFTIVSGTALSSARAWKEGDLVLAASRAAGLGKIVLLGFNPFEDPFVRWQGRKKLFVNVARPSDYDRANNYLNQFQADSRSQEYYYGGSAPAYYGGRPVADDPFNVQLPPPGKVFWILVGYFVVVVPLNFMVLRRLKRGELAWITAPVISLVFAGIFLNQASDLYAAQLSTATSGLVVSQSGVPGSVFVGTTQMFFPHGGSYDLKLRNVDQLGTNSAGPMFGEGEARTDLNPVDVGSVEVPEMRAANLAFEEIDYRQLLESQPLLVGEVVHQDSRTMTIRLTNPGQFPERDVNLIFRGAQFAVGTIDPGQSHDAVIPLKGWDSRNNDGNALAALTNRFPVIVAHGMIDGLRPGPQLGQQVESKTKIAFACVMDLAVGGGGQ